VSKLATDHDPRDLTAALVCAAAGIPRRRFDAHFDGMGDCLLAALEARIREILADAQHAAALRQSRAGGLYRALSEVCSEIDADPAFAAFVLDAASLTVDWGVLGARQRERLLGAVIARVYGSGPFSSVRRLEVEASVEAAWGLLCRWVAGGRVGRVGQLAGAMTMLLLAADARSERVATAVETEAEACLAKTGHSTNLAKAV
jgi:AcrR family transcriptional regulator